MRESRRTRLQVTTEDGLRRITLALTGDVMLGRLMNDIIHAYGPSYPWGNTLPLLSGADLSLINLECVIATDGHPWTRTPKAFFFRADPIAVDVLNVAGIDCVSLANNHSLDYREDAMLEMIGILEANGIAHAGAGQNILEAMRPSFIDAQGIKLGVISLTDNEPAWEATEKTPGVNYVAITTRGRYFQRVKRSIQEARDGGADLIVLSSHWGPNMRLRPTSQFRSFAHAVIDEGVDIFHGHSAHVFQGIEIYKGRPIIYDAGDFVDDYAVDDVLRNDWSLLYKLTATATRVERVELFPVLISGFQANLAVGEDFEGICRRIQELSAEMGTEMKRLDNSLEVTVS